MSGATVWQQPTLVVVTGLPGTGKSTLAEGIATAAGAPAFSVDWLLGAIAPSGVLDGAPRPVVRGIYERLLRSLLSRQLMLGQSAILDTIAADETIQEWSSIAHQHGGRLITIECVCSNEAVHRSRIEGRTRNIPGWHEIDWSHVEFMKTELEPLSVPHFTVDAIEPAGSNLTAVLGHIHSG
ncbi:AAA family ATPase [Microbacterium sp. CFBP9034]|uniref:AAA family ATPase n=1 Tax=Microbacterium sp. CFBP9034 TaxID=3096540 RepID=UPI002A69B6F2|nr:AAA family ATPase [Microbacterium sp. CFBP9034]MDY0910481.1 AAA family ATPase [Microbacterium sp. CFBP9034]